MEQQKQLALVAEIHNDFDSAEERLLNEAKQIIANDSKAAELRAERVKKLGFGSAKAIKDADTILGLKRKAPELIATINYFKQYYPLNKFITEDEVKKLCEKYGLVFGDAGDYVGDIPEKNICEIENFKLRKEDWLPKQASWTINNYLMDALMTSHYYQPTSFDTNELGLIRTKPRRSGSFFFENPFYGIDPYRIDFDNSSKTFVSGKSEEKKEVETEKPAFKICAPKEDFKTMGMIVVDGYKLIDPIVLQPVKDGYLIVSKWGLEASDEIVINEINN